MAKNKINLSFTAINPYIYDNIESAEEKQVRNQGFISWGNNNRFPFYIYELYKDVPTLHSIIDGCVDYTCGDKIVSSLSYIDTLVRDVALSYWLFGGFAIAVYKNKAGKIYELECLDFRNVRSNKDNTVFYYSPDFNSRSYGRCKMNIYAKYVPEFSNTDTTIYYYKNTKYQVYPLSVWHSAIKSCEIERSIDIYHLNNINNGFVGSVMVNMNNGTPDQEVQEEIERNFNEKFAGKENAGRIVISYSDDKEHAATIEKIETEDFSARYEALANRSRSQIYASFRVTPNIFGLPTETTGFNSQEYTDAFTLFNHTVIYPVQQNIINVINEILGDNTVMIEPFKVNFTQKND